jgi:hypothetical protein
MSNDRINELPICARLTAEDIARFWANVDRRSANECWPWRGHKLKKANRGTFRVGGTTVTAARIALALHQAAPSGGLFACHSCDNAECCNPSHLHWGTAQDNRRECVERGRVHRWNGTRRGQANQQAKLTDEQARTIRTAAGWPQSAWQLASEFGVSIHTVRDVRYGRSFQNVG